MFDPRQALLEHDEARAGSVDHDFPTAAIEGADEPRFIVQHGHADHLVDIAVVVALLEATLADVFHVGKIPR